MVLIAFPSLLTLLVGVVAATSNPSGLGSNSADPIPCGAGKLVGTHSSIITSSSQIAMSPAIYTISIVTDCCEIVTRSPRKVDQNTNMPTTTHALPGEASRHSSRAYGTPSLDCGD
jgi:hypothetical protein